MALRDIWRGRERSGEDRERDRWRSMNDDWRREEDWRDEDRYGREREYSTAGQRYGERNWSPERDYSGGRDYSQSFGGSRSQGGQGDYERDEGRRYGPEYGRGSFGQSYAGGQRGQQSYQRGERYGSGSASGGAYEQAGQFRGRGPRGYQRADERIREDVCERLTDDPQIDASNLEVNVKNGEVTLSGSVSSRNDKRRAEECAEDVSGVKDVHNTLRVSTEGGAGAQTGTQQTAQQTARH